MLEGDFYTAQDLADKLQVNVMTIYRYIRSDKLSAYKIGKEYRISKEDFNNFLNKSKTENQI
jgi:excisionase family DNA binding protein